MLEYLTIREMVDKALESGVNISQLVLEDQAKELEKDEKELIEEMTMRWEVMKSSALDGIIPELRSTSGLSGGMAYKYKSAAERGITFGGGVLDSLITKALAVSESNACMGRIVAAPTAGSCGILPSVLITAVEQKVTTEEKAVMGLFTAAGIGILIAKTAGISGAEGGCQAECGSASAMAAAALAEVMGGDAGKVSNACAIALKNILGLVCDPVAGLVEVPCVKRNAMGAANAVVACNMALAEIESVIPADEVIAAMKSIGDAMSVTLKETADGGLAATPTGKKLKEKLVAKIPAS